MRNWLMKFQRCPGCGDYLIQLAIKQAIQELNIPKHKLVILSWIGCSGKMSQYIDGYGSETLHWRWVPFATWVKLANPDLTVISISGDGDAYGIWVWHFLHACRRNINITYIVLNNENYGLTTGQASPTTPLDIKTKSTPDWNHTNPFDPNKLAESAWCQFTKNVQDKDIKTLKQTIIDWINFPGFAHIDVNQACPSRRKW